MRAAVCYALPRWDRGNTLAHALNVYARLDNVQPYISRRELHVINKKNTVALFAESGGRRE